MRAASTMSAALMHSRRLAVPCAKPAVGRYRQALLSYKLIFHVPADYTIAHLDGKVFTADTRPITQIFTGDDSNER